MELLMTKKFNNSIYMKIIYKLIPYIIIFLFTLAACQLSFSDGYPRGDDFSFHTSNIYDWYLELKGDGTQLISSNLAGHLGIGKKLFYSPLPHFVPAFISYVFHVDVVTSMKITLVSSVFISGVFMYRFALKITNHMPILSILVAGIFVLWPYRLFDAYCRLAYAEAISFLFLPLFFMGLYDLCHIKELNIIPFLEIIFGGVLLFLTHNLTGFYAFFFGGIYLVFNIKKIIKLIMKDKLLIAFTAISVFIMIGMLLLTILSSYTLLNKDYYNISNTTYMWTTVKHVTNRNNDATDYSGFLNIVYLKSQNMATPTELIGGIVASFLAIASLILLNELFKSLSLKYNKYKALDIINKYQLYLILSLIIFIIFVKLAVDRKEVIIASYVAGLLYIFIELFNDKPKENPNLTSSVGFYSYAILLILTLFMIFFGFFWKHAPQLFLNIQFPWRLWAFVSLFVPVLIAMILRKYNKKQYYIVVACLLSLLVSTNMATIEKRIRKNLDEGNWFYDVDETYFVNYRYSTGACFEYFPYMYSPNETEYTSEYSNSLYSKVRNIIYNYHLSAYDINPAVLEGSGTVTIDKEKTRTPEFVLNCEIEEDNTLIQLPLIYYPGYEIKAKMDGKTVKCKVIDVDGLVSFYIDNGTYEVKTEYVGTSLRHKTEALQVISVIALFGLGYLEFVITLKKYKKQQLILE